MSANAMNDADDHGHGDRDEDDAFQLPMLGLYADLEAGCGSVLLPDEFHQAEPALQRRILADWQRGLAALQQGLAHAPAPGAVGEAEAAGPGAVAGDPPAQH